MKRITNLLLAAAVLFTAFSCDLIPQPDNQPDGSKYAAAPALQILSKNVVFTPEGGSGLIVVNTKDQVSAWSERPWAALSISDNRVTVTVPRNESLESRYSTVTLKAGGATAEIIVQQFGVNSAYLWDDSYTFPYPGGELTLPYSEVGTVKVAIEGTSWIAADVDEQAKTIHFTVSKSIYNYKRTGTVTVTIGEIVRTVTFIQEENPNGLMPGQQEPMEFTLESAWSPYYVAPADDAQAYCTVGVEVAEDSHAGRYFIKVLPTSGININDMDELQLYLNLHAPEWAAASPTIHRTSAQEEIERLPLGSYVVGAIGVDNDNLVNGKVAFTLFSVTKVLSPYEKFLGTWSFTRGDEEDTWTVTEKVPNESYSVTGLDGIDDIAVEALFNAADNTVTFRTQTDLGQRTVNTSDGEKTGDVAFYGKIVYQGSTYYVSGNYTVFTLKVSDDSSIATITPGNVHLNVGDFVCSAFALFTLVGESAYSTQNPSNIHDGMTITHLTQGDGSGGGGGGDNPGTDNYAKWLGTWNAGGVSLTFAQETAGQTYTVSGLGLEFTARYVASTGNVEFFGQHISDQDPYEFYFVGIDTDNYIEFGDQNRDNLLATAVLSADGKSASVTGAEYQAVYSGVTYDEKIASLCLVAYNTEDEKYYSSSSWSEVDIPVTMTKGSSASVFSVRTASYDMAKGRFIPLYKVIGPMSASPYKRR